jgi:nucleoside-diphosphate-sugar epimerase
MAHHALVFGASGILGWAIVNEILNNYPNPDTYSKVTALTNRPLTREASLWPGHSPGMPELDIVSGIDLTKGSIEEVGETLKERVPGIETVMHVFYFGKFLLLIGSI